MQPLPLWKRLYDLFTQGSPMVTHHDHLHSVMLMHFGRFFSLFQNVLYSRSQSNKIELIWSYSTDKIIHV